MNNNDNDNDNDLEDNNQYQDIFHDTDMIIPKNGYSLKSAVSFIGGKKKTNDKNIKNDNFSKKKDNFSNSISEELNLDHLAIPPSLYYMEYTVTPTYQNYSNTCGDDNDDNDNDDNDKMISDSVYDKLLLLAEDSSRKQKKYTKRNKKNVKNDKKDKNKNRKTRRNK